MTIGITGGIGSGKSTIAAELVRRGYRVYDCDREAKRIIEENRDVQTQIMALLGEEAFANGRYNTSFVARRVFTDPALLEQLNKIVHPAVVKDIKSLPSFQGEEGGRLLLFIESAILYESGFDQLCDRVVLVDAPVEMRIARTVARDHCDAEQVRARIRSQHTLPHEKAIVLTNDGSQSINALVDSLIAKL